MRLLVLLLGALSLPACAALADLAPERAEPFRGCDVTVYVLGRQQPGVLDERSCAIQGGRRIDYYEIRLNAPQRVAIRVGSREFDTFLYLFDRQGNELASNDDITPFLNTDSRITRDLEPGRYVIGVTASSAQGLGAYSLTSEVR
jgi:hypothetical protein